MCTNSARLVNSLECYMDDLVDSFEDFVKKSLFIISVAVGAVIVMLGYVLKLVTERQLGLAGPGIPGALAGPGTPGALEAPGTPGALAGPGTTGAIPGFPARNSSGAATPSSCSPNCPRRNSMANMSVENLKQLKSNTIPQRPANNVAMPVLRKDAGLATTTSAGANTAPMAGVPSFDETVLRNIGLSSCSKSCLQGKRSILRNSSASRIVIPSMPTCLPNHHLSTSRQCSKYFASRNSCCSMCCADDDRR